MRRFFIFLLPVALLLSSCNQDPKKDDTKKDEVTKLSKDNPFFAEKYNTPFEVPPFEKIKEPHYMPAFKEGMKQQKAEIAKIVTNKEAANFKNTIAALDYSGELLTKVESVFYNLLGSDKTDGLQKIAKEISPLSTAHSADIMMNAGLFKRVKAVYDNQAKFKLNTEQKQLLKKTYLSFVRNGANLNAGDQAKLRKIDGELSMLALKFGENQLAESNSFKLIIDKKADLKGLPESAIAGAAEAAKAAKMNGKWIFTLDKPSMIPFLQYSAKRELREKIYKGYINRANNNNANDNKKVLAKITNLRIKRANLLGYKNHAAYVLDNNMAKTPEKAYELLNKLWKAALPVAKKEAKALQAMVKKEGGKFELAAWDWWYYSEKLRKAKYDLDEEMLRPYFELNNVRKGMFGVATKLFGLKFKELKDIPKYNKDAQAFEVMEADGKHIGILYMDYHPRPSKRSGAWMNSFRKQCRKNGKNVSPVIVNVLNFSKPVGDKPALLTFEEVTTLYHEFGHGLHGLLSNCTYNSISGTSVPRDFVEMPSQVMENWASEPEVLKTYAKHYKTGKVIPDAIIKKIQNSGHFNQGFVTAEYLAASLLDFKYHTLEKVQDIDAAKFEKATLDEIGLIPEIAARYRSTYFAHIFSGGYSAGYYVYIWAAVLDADAFQAFKENGLFDQKTAKALRENVFSRGSSDDAMKLYKQFRGADPKIEPLLNRRGLKL